MTKKRAILIILVLLLVVALLQIDRADLLYSVRRVPLWLVFVLVGLQVVTQLVVNFQWFWIARLAGAKVSFGDMLHVNAQGAVVDGITPGVKFGGEVTRAVQISRVGGLPGAQAAAIVALQKLFSVSALFVVLLFVAGRATGWQVVLYGVMGAFIAAFVVAVAVPERISLFVERKAPRRAWLRRVRDFFSVLLGYVKIVRENRGALVSLPLLSLFIWLLFPAKMYLLALQFTPAAGVALIGGIVFAAYMVAMLPIFPGGVGGFEGTMSGLLVAGGYALHDAAVMTVVFRFVTFWLVLFMGLVFAAVYKAVKSVG